ncbi:non-heme iron oxygenase ferredoxin subunit [Candidatus Bathyarchaeota archaeon]|nr:non-heme iron oxygenase ferredoxin subunit [Candidatus Bathyarchaeota archaeon]
MTELGYVKAAEKSEIPVGEMRMVKINGKEVLIANVNGNYYAINNRCTHAGSDLSQGVLEGNVVTCPTHHSKFDVTTGKVVSPPKVGFFHPRIQDEPSYPVKVENEDIMVKL